MRYEVHCDGPPDHLTDEVLHAFAVRKMRCPRLFFVGLTLHYPIPSTGAGGAIRVHVCQAWPGMSGICPLLASAHQHHLQHLLLLQRQPLPQPPKSLPALPNTFPSHRPASTRRQCSPIRLGRRVVAAAAAAGPDGPPSGPSSQPQPAPENEMLRNTSTSALEEGEDVGLLPPSSSSAISAGGKASSQSSRIAALKQWLEQPLIKAIFLAQALSFLLCIMGTTSGMLVARGIDMPTTQAVLNYVLLAVTCGAVHLRAVGPRLSNPWYVYVLLALLDVEGNYLVIKAYQAGAAARHPARLRSSKRRPAFLCNCMHLVVQPRPPTTNPLATGDGAGAGKRFQCLSWSRAST